MNTILSKNAKKSKLFNQNELILNGYTAREIVNSLDEEQFSLCIIAMYGNNEVLDFLSSKTDNDYSDDNSQFNQIYLTMNDKQRLILTLASHGNSDISKLLIERSNYINMDIFK